MRKTF